ncbi:MULTISPECIES: hypothetical protein [unclassified Neorhizobium]|uniref:hypothetical protein n=1 Tax=unclassified Neorhizobium TaxID=2629175 RepID=UPI001404EC9F|nr:MULTISPECIES: hypothetical protein [unclassified Neorhizobium]
MALVAQGEQTSASGHAKKAKSDGFNRCGRSPQQTVAEKVARHENKIPLEDDHIINPPVSPDFEKTDRGKRQGGNHKSQQDAVDIERRPERPAENEIGKQNIKEICRHNTEDRIDIVQPQGKDGDKPEIREHRQIKTPHPPVFGLSPEFDCEGKEDEYRQQPRRLKIDDPVEDAGDADADRYAWRHKHENHIKQQGLL